jgi:hypothetical protein
MLRRAAALCVLVFAAAIADPIAQSRPDFSGEWRPPARDTPPQQPTGGGPPPPPRTLSITITQTTDELKIARRVETDGHEAVYNFTYKLDGTESVNQMGPLVFYTRGSWEGGSLVLASDVSVEDRRIGTLRESYTLEDGKLTIDTIRTGPAGTMKDKTVHEKVVRPSP